MSDSQLLVWFYIGCGVVGLPLMLVAVAKRMAVQERGRVESAARSIAVGDSSELEAKREELMVIVARSLGMKREKLTSGSRFEDDLRVPPGELDSLLEEIEERYGIAIESRRVKSVADILSVVRLKADRA